MTQLTIKLTDRDYQKIKKKARKLGKPIDVFVCELITNFKDEKVEIDLATDPLYQFEGFESDAPSDLSSNVDGYLYGNGI